VTSPVTHIIIGGVSLDLADVEYQISVTHGRNDIKSQPEASTAVIALRGSEGVAIDLAATVDITTYGFRRFTGEVTDLAITHLSSTPPTAITTITCIGNLSNLGSRITGASGYASETVYSRAEEILTDSGETFLNGGTTSLELYSVSAGNAQPQTCLDGLQALAEWSGGTYFDTPEGYVVFESYGNRGSTAFPGAWGAQINTWAEAEASWDSYPSTTAATSLPSNGVIFTPAWTQNQVSIINDATVSHGSSPSYHQATDATSIATYGRRALTLETGLKANADAISRANAILLAQAYPLWNLGNISIYVDQLTVPERDQVLALISGSSVLVNDLPQPAPFEQFLGLVEGWSETYTPGQHILTLSISDPRYSYQTVTWGEVSPTLQWGDVDPTLIWYNVVTADDLIAA
jgi:hypothetical protein